MGSFRRFGSWLSRRMKEERWSSRLLANEIRPDENGQGVSHTTIGRWRRGEGLIFPHHVKELARIFGVPVRQVLELLGYYEPMGELSPEHEWVIETISHLTDQQVELVEGMLKALLEQQAESEAAAGSQDSARGNPQPDIASDASSL